MKRIVAWFALVLCAGMAAGQSYFFRGMSYTPWSKDALLQQTSNLSLDRMRLDGVEWVALNVWWFQDNENSSIITEDFSRYSASRESVRYAIQQMHGRGMKVLLKPNIDCRNGAWRGAINPSTNWFNGYKTFIGIWADLAREEGVEALCIGCEYVKTDSWATQWREVATLVRLKFSGPITYAANHGAEQSITWWDALDFIGIDAYYVLTSKNNPTRTELLNAWISRRNSIRTWRNSKWPTKTVVFTEVGYRSMDGTNKAPWDYSSSAAVDLQEQVDCYQALFSALWEESWWGGVFWWNWETSHTAGGMFDKGFTPQGKPVEKLIAQYYKRVPRTVPLQPGSALGIIR